MVPKVCRHRFANSARRLQIYLLGDLKSGLHFFGEEMKSLLVAMVKMGQHSPEEGDEILGDSKP